MEGLGCWGIRNCKDVDVVDELVLDVLDRMRGKYANDADYGREVRALMVRLRDGVDRGIEEMV